MTDVLLARYAPSVVLLAWSALWAVGLRGDVVIGMFLALTALAVVVSYTERWKR